MQKSIWAGWLYWPTDWWRVCIRSGYLWNKLFFIPRRGENKGGAVHMTRYACLWVFLCCCFFFLLTLDLFMHDQCKVVSLQDAGQFPQIISQTDLRMKTSHGILLLNAAIKIWLMIFKPMLQCRVFMSFVSGSQCNILACIKSMNTRLFQGTWLDITVCFG